MSQKLEILIQGKDQLSPAANSAQKSLDGLGVSADNADKKTTSLWKQMAGGALVAQGVTMAVGALARGIKDFVKSSVDLAINTEETMSKFGTVFQDVTDVANKSLQDLTENYGLSRRAAADMLSGTGDLLTGLGMTGSAALDLSEQTQKLAVDLASFTNYSGGAEGASQALTKAMLGEREMLKSLGITISEEMVKAELMANGQSRLEGTALLAAKAQATLTLAMRQSPNAIGDYARTMDSAANVTRRIAAEWENVSVEIGKSFLGEIRPAMAELLKWLQDNKGEIVEFGKSAARAFGDVAGAVGALLKILYALRGVIAEIPTLLAPQAASAAGVRKYMEEQAEGYRQIYELRDKALNMVPDAVNAAMKKGIEDAKAAEKQRHQEFLQQVNERGERLAKAYQNEYAEQVKIEEQARKINAELAKAPTLITPQMKPGFDLLKKMVPEAAQLGAYMGLTAEKTVPIPGMVHDTEVSLVGINGEVTEWAQKMKGVSMETYDVSDLFKGLADSLRDMGIQSNSLNTGLGMLGNVLKLKVGQEGVTSATKLNGALAAGAQIAEGLMETLGVDMSSGFGQAAGGVLDGLTTAAAGGFSPISIAMGAIQALGGIAGALFGQTGLDDTIEGLKRVGITISDSLVKRLEEARKAGQDVGAEMARVTSQIIRDTELTGQNFGTLSKMVRDVFMQFDNGRLSVEEATKVYGDAFVELAKKAEDAGMAGSKALADMIGDARNRGMVGKDMLAFIDPARMAGLNAMAAHIRATSDTAEGFAAAQRQTMAFFQSMQADGKSVIEIIEALGPALDELKATGEAQGYDTGYLSQLFGMRDFLEQNKDVIEGIQATQAVMDSMAKTGILTQERFTEFAASAWDYYNKLSDEGKTSEQALQALLPMLGKQLWYAEQYGYELDENTRKLIEEAKAQGMKLDAAIPAEERMAAGIEKLVELFERLTGGIDGATSAIGRMADAAGQISIPDFGYGDGTPAPGEPLTGFATGTRGFQRLPSTYVVGENGPELVRQSGGRTSITPIGGMAQGQTIQLVLPNVRDPYSAQQLKRDLEMNEAGLTTYLAARVGRG
ncbi:MAG TPA: hypothetical protein VLH56_11355 [Dissulfurispiraceae bacterium]|nr:hypothetical protein [Dissulfurispiraceae bacterium]